MSDALAAITQVHGLGMILIRADLDRAADSIAAAAGLAIPDKLRFTTAGSRWLGWMSPDELLLILPHAGMPEALSALADALSTEHALVQDVSDMRCVFDLAGQAPEQVLAKLCPVDFGTLPEDAVRRTRAAQVACALWRQGDGWRIVAFRAITDYLRQVLEGAAAPGTQLDPR
ncbi:MULTISPECIES: sarcosine oxidase subunit gamma [unclassified Paracoccus (in: a-proteobacteria)]|uniref:sarcosine oxidase subunit gamma n=1 Tax=unclassified Paracoccus (in: a-proteobacteria) TaxID=2688777 RepID=UPI0016017CEB|nr:MULTISPECIES: sarcosine oxidase subunit gamma family protein [unclassified Paracoccus (in: a-proteobacteria)]MBB1490760.1 sarcosine oxidase subunit gamma [Paracoccus sp. MC1854]MBB1497397.1 sarcosine oxidase subunit gamma [Paracoccus sp. MC1862]QQO45888.1 sarcosine oxidase subunit gamma [Paracoccus sp. MC1862]